MNSIVKEDWIDVELGEVCFTTSGGTPSRNNIEFYQGSIPWVKSGELDKGIIYDTEEHISEDAVKKSSAKIFPEGTLLIALYGATIGKLSFLGVEAATNQAICGIFKSIAVDPKYLFNFLLNRRQKLISQGTGGAQPNISQTILKNLEIPLAPLPIQRAIVSKIEALFSDLDNGIANFKTAQAQLKIYRQAVLKKAFEGGFSITNEELEITNEKNHSSDNLPSGWKWVKMKDLGTWRGGGTPSKKIANYWENGTNLWVTSKDMKVGIINDSIDKITDEAILNSSANKIPKGAILFVMRSGILRHTFPVAIAGKELTVNQDLQTLSPNGLATSEFIYWFVRAFNYEIRHKCSKDGTTVESIESSSLKDYPFILPPIEEQTAIVQEIESRLSVCDKMEQSLTESIAKAETLRQSILKKAFEGKLLSEAEIAQCKQAADYEPASELLKKIQAEKLANSLKKTQKNGKQDRAHRL